ncbi:hypothetical protein LPJ57_000332 [Coemansia sp. RSA 486]|nr:hypothetical protein LPJ57_000332 [Coemansia sp. RSA 486]KAJ2233765.1 hypothetical protein IWW45_003932 [Coemansia sp. RSA 485]
MAPADTTTQEGQQPRATHRSRRGRYLSLTPWAIALLLVAQKAQALQQQPQAQAQAHTNVVANGIRPINVSTRVQAFGRLAGSNDRGYATDSDNEGSGSDSDSDDKEQLYKKGGKGHKKHEGHEGHGGGYDQVVTNPYHAVPNPYQYVPNPYQTAPPSPYQSVPNPYQSAPNPYQSAPNPYQSAPNPYQTAPHPPSACQSAPYVPYPTIIPLPAPIQPIGQPVGQPINQPAQGNVAAIVYSPIITVQPTAGISPAIIQPTGIPSTVTITPTTPTTTLPTPVYSQSTNGYGHFGFPEADGFENYYSSSSSNIPTTTPVQPTVTVMPTSTSISIVPFQVPASAVAPVTVTNTEKTTVTESFTTFTTNAAQAVGAQTGQGMTIVQNFYETTMVDRDIGPQAQPTRTNPCPWLVMPTGYAHGQQPGRPGNPRGWPTGPQIQPTTGWPVGPTGPQIQPTTGWPVGPTGPQIQPTTWWPVGPTGPSGPQIQPPSLWPAPTPRPGTSHACPYHPAQPLQPAQQQPQPQPQPQPQQGANAAATTIIQQPIYLPYTTDSHDISTLTPLGVSTAITASTAYVGATIFGGNRAVDTTPIAKFTDEQQETSSQTAAKETDDALAQATPIVRPHGSHHAITDAARKSVSDDSDAFTPRSFNANTLDGSIDAADTVRNRPEVGQTTQTTTNEAQTTDTLIDADDQTHVPMQTDETGVWERMMQPTKTANLPELLDRPLATPDAQPQAPAEKPSLNGLRLDPMQPGGVDFYPTAELSGLRSADFPARISEDVWRVIESMTLEEKVGQMLQVPVAKLLTPDGYLNATAVDYWINVAKAGTFVDTPGNSAKGRYAWYAPQTLANLTNAVQQASLAGGSRIPALWAMDAVRGASFVKRAAMFPAGIGMAATMQPQFAYAAGRIAAKDARSAGYSLAIAPSADLLVDKRTGSGFLGFGEDPAVNSVMVRHTVRGLQGDYKTDRHRVAACVRHFIGAGAVPDNALFEYHLPGFQAAIGAGVAAIEQQRTLNGQALSAAPFYLRKLLRESMGFRGIMLGDPSAALLRTAANSTDAVFLSLNNTSVDMANDPALFADAVQLVRTGVVPEDRITESAARIVQLKKDLGLFDRPFADSSLPSTVGALQDVEVARSAVRESLTLLKNSAHALPLRMEDRVLFVGRTLNSTALLSGGWAVHRNGPTELESRNDAVFEGLGHSIMQGVEQVTGRQATFHQGLKHEGSVADDELVLQELVRRARMADKIVVGLGESSVVGDLSLDARQMSLVRRLATTTDKPLVAVLVSGRPRILHDVVDHASSLLMAYLPGVHGGLPIAQTLYGQSSPSGRLPFTYPRYEYQSHDTIWQSQSLEYAPLYPFGFGLGYSPMEYSNVTVDSTELRPGNPVTIRVTVHNKGMVDQKEPVMLYTSQNFRTGYEPELFRLRKFDKVEIKAGMATQVEFTLKAEELAYYNRDLVRVIDPSPVNITINALTPHERTITVNLSV